MIETRPRTPFRAAAVLPLVALIGLSACSEDMQPFGAFGTRDATADGPVPIGATRLVERDIEAPDVFQVTENGLWDGRPSLGGVWVAHPTADDPERVIIRNAENGRFVIGALFRRERDLPGPDLMVSSDAAAALNVLAGAPTELQVTALRREEVPDPTATVQEPDLTVASAEAPEVAEITETTLGDPIAAAAAAIAESEAVVETAALAVEPETRPATPATASETTLERAFVQIGIFSVQDNANNTGQALRNVGLTPTIYDQASNDRQFWRVVVGPAQSTEERASMLETVRGLGFDDAYFVTR